MSTKQKLIIVPRYHYKGEYKGEPKRPIREGSDLLANAPSRFGDMLYYPDGRRVKLEDRYA